MKILELPLKKEWYIMIEAGEKPEEYREIKPYWITRLLIGGYGSPNIFQSYTHVRYRYGYTKRTMLYEIESISIGIGNPKWGAPEDREVFIIRNGKRIKQND